MQRVGLQRVHLSRPKSISADKGRSENSVGRNRMLYRGAGHIRHEQFDVCFAPIADIPIWVNIPKVSDIRRTSFTPLTGTMVEMARNAIPDEVDERFQLAESPAI